MESTIMASTAACYRLVYEPLSFANRQAGTLFPTHLVSRVREVHGGDEPGQTAADHTDVQLLVRVLHLKWSDTPTAENGQDPMCVPLLILMLSSETGGLISPPPRSLHSVKNFPRWV